MTSLPTLQTNHILLSFRLISVLVLYVLRIRLNLPDFEASVLLVAGHFALSAHSHILARAFRSFVSHHVAFEA